MATGHSSLLRSCGTDASPGNMSGKQQHTDHLTPEQRCRSKQTNNSTCCRRLAQQPDDGVGAVPGVLDGSGKVQPVRESSGFQTESQIEDKIAGLVRPLAARLPLKGFVDIHVGRILLVLYARSER